MTALGFCVVAALSSHTSGRPFTCSCRMGKSRRMNCGSNGRAETATSGTRSGRNSKDAMLSDGAAAAGARALQLVEALVGELFSELFLELFHLFDGLFGHAVLLS